MMRTFAVSQTASTPQSAAIPQAAAISQTASILQTASGRCHAVFFCSLLLACALVLVPAGRPACAEDDADVEDDTYVRDVEAACDEIARACGPLLERKKIDWSPVRTEFVKAAEDVSNDEEHLALLLRLVARLQDGHATVRRTDKTKDVPYPDAGVERKGPGMAWCRIGRKLYVKNAWSSAQRVGIEPGMEVVQVEGKPAARWFAARLASLRDRIGFSTDHHAEAYGFHWGLAEPIGTRVDYVVRDRKGKRRKRTVVCERAGVAASGPAFPPEGLKGDRDVTYGRTLGGFGYIHYRRCKASVPYRTDDALKAIGRVPGLILDFRANGGGGFSHEDLMGRFIPPGREIAFQKRYASRGEASFGGPIVVIVDGVTRSAGETASGMFKEDGRAYMIGPSPTAGMSSSKTTIDLPSARFQLYVSVRSNMGRFQDGKGIEGIGVIPHEIVAYDPDDLAARRDTQILRAEALLAAYPRKGFPKKAVPYQPARFGWKAP